MGHQVAPDMNIEAKRTLSATISEIRTSKGISQGALAVTVGLQRTFLSHVEHGRRLPTLSNLFAIAKALSVPPHVLLFLKKHRSSS